MEQKKLVQQVNVCLEDVASLLQEYSIHQSGVLDLCLQFLREAQEHINCMEVQSMHQLKVRNGGFLPEKVEELRNVLEETGQNPMLWTEEKRQAVIEDLEALIEKGKEVGI